MEKKEEEKGKVEEKVKRGLGKIKEGVKKGAKEVIAGVKEGLGGKEEESLARVVARAATKKMMQKAEQKRKKERERKKERLKKAIKEEASAREFFTRSALEKFSSEEVGNITFTKSPLVESEFRGLRFESEGKKFEPVFKTRRLW